MRSKETIQQELTETRTRLSAYLAREADMLSKDGGAALHNRLQKPATVPDFARFRSGHDREAAKRVRELEAELAGGSARRAGGGTSPATGKWVNAGRSAGFTTATTAGLFRSFRYRGRCRF